jgi:hypothetical protein
MARSSAWRSAFSVAALSALVLGCAGSPIAAPIEGEPLCPDFQERGVMMAGGLRYPVRIRVLDGKNVLYKSILPGLRTAGGKQPSTFIVDDNAEYTVEWAQCENERAPRDVATEAREHKEKARSKMREDEGAGYECGEAKVYKTDKLVTRKHDPASHVIKFVPPPNPACWQGDAAPAAPAPSGSAAVPAAPAPSGSAAVPPPPPAPPPVAPMPAPAPSK